MMKDKKRFGINMKSLHVIINHLIQNNDIDMITIIHICKYVSIIRGKIILHVIFYVILYAQCMHGI